MYLRVCLPPIQKADTLTDTLKTVILTVGLDSIHIFECYFIIIFANNLYTSDDKR